MKSTDPLYGREQEKLLIRKFNTFYNRINKELWWLQYWRTCAIFVNKLTELDQERSIPCCPGVNAFLFSSLSYVSPISLLLGPLFYHIFLPLQPISYFILHNPHSSSSSIYSIVHFFYILSVILCWFYKSI